VIVAQGDQALVVRLGERIDPGIGDRVLGVLARLDGERPGGVVDVVPGYASVMVIYDSAGADRGEVWRWLEEASESGEVVRLPRRRVEIPVAYDGPDLEGLASEKGMAVEEVVALHSGVEYRCYMLGFRPGFPFLGGMDARLAAPRLSTPRVRVPAGSVGIGGRQTGVYPVDSPGGWRLIGRTEVRLFDAQRADPFLVSAGDVVVFRPV
jgi:inhibitor of KinA